jgi:hypothetical protein
MEVIQQNPNQSTYSGLYNTLLHQREGPYPTSFETIEKTRLKTQMLEQDVNETSFHYFTLPFCDSKVFSSVYVVNRILTPSSHKPSPTCFVFYQETPNQCPTKISAIYIQFPNAVKNPINFHWNFPAAIPILPSCLTAGWYVANLNSPLPDPCVSI